LERRFLEIAIDLKIKKSKKLRHFLVLIDLDVGVLKDIKHSNLVMGG